MRVLDLNHFILGGLFSYPLKTSENQKFSDVFMGYRKKETSVTKWLQFVKDSFVKTDDNAYK